jgi:hypothetical protein
LTESRLPPELIAEVRARTDLAALAGRMTTLRRQGSRLVGLCPFHRERTPSLFVNRARGSYHCFGCGARGSAIDFAMAAWNIGFREAVETLARDAGIEIGGRRTDDGGRTQDPRGGLAFRPPSSVRRRPAPVVCRPSSEEEVRGHQLRERVKAHEIWQGRQALAGSVAEAYLVEARRLSAAWARACPVLGFAPKLPYWGPAASGGDKPELIWEGPALLAAMQYPDGRFAAVHVTYLKPGGAGTLELYQAPGVLRPAKKVRGVPGGAAIRLTPPAPHMVVGEGIETTASAFGTVPHGWAAYSLDNLTGAALGTGPRDPRDRRKRLPSEIPDMGRPGLQLPRECGHVTFLGDGDTNDLLMLEAKLRRAVRRQLQLGIEADYVLTPPGTDLNDVLRGERAA